LEFAPSRVVFQFGRSVVQRFGSVQDAGTPVE
jgi:hypothetical protein